MFGPGKKQREPYSPSKRRSDLIRREERKEKSHDIAPTPRQVPLRLQRENYFPPAMGGK